MVSLQSVYAPILNIPSTIGVAASNRRRFTALLVRRLYTVMLLQSVYGALGPDLEIFRAQSGNASPNGRRFAVVLVARLYALFESLQSAYAPILKYSEHNPRRGAE